jgi:hypothetical protein
MKRTRAIFVVGLAGLFTLLVWVFARSRSSYEQPAVFHPQRTGLTLSIARLTNSEKVLIGVRQFHLHDVSERLYQIEGGAVPKFGARSLLEQERAPEVTGRLTDADVIGLDALLVFLRHGDSAGVDSRAEVVVAYYRGDRKLGEEKFRGDLYFLPSSVASARQSGRTFSNCPSDFPIEVYREIVTPGEIERGLRKPNFPQPSPPSRRG